VPFYIIQGSNVAIDAILRGGHCQCARVGSAVSRLNFRGPRAAPHPPVDKRAVFGSLLPKPHEAWAREEGGSLFSCLAMS